MRSCRATRSCLMSAARRGRLGLAGSTTRSRLARRGRSDAVVHWDEKEKREEKIRKIKRMEPRNDDVKEYRKI